MTNFHRKGLVQQQPIIFLLQISHQYDSQIKTVLQISNTNSYLDKIVIRLESLGLKINYLNFNRKEAEAKNCKKNI
jgi:hypothetical protein